MNKVKGIRYSIRNSRLFYTVLALTLSLVLFYLPTILFQVENAEKIWEWDFLGIIMASFYSFTFLLNYFWLVPSLLKRKSRVSLFIGVNLVLVIITMFAIPVWIESSACPVHSRLGAEGRMEIGKLFIHYAGFSVRDGIMVVLSAALGYAIRMGREKEDLVYQELQLKAEKRKVELQSLKGQLNPHFLFNSINNIYALIGIAPDRAQDALHSLSNMMRFLIYESSEPVDVGKEGRFIEEYVELMKLRMPMECKVNCEVSDALPQGLKISPLLYVTLVENAFKHSAIARGNFYIHIRMYSTCIEGEEGEKRILVFKVENSCPEAEEDEKMAESKAGVGLSNVRRQLNLLYPGEYLFEIMKGGGKYSATIAINEKALENQDGKES